MYIYIYIGDSTIDFHSRILISEKIRIATNLLRKWAFASVVKFFNGGTFHDFISGSPVDLMSLPRGLL